MAKFCTNCGKELVDGVCPNCSNKSSQSSNGFGSIMKEYWEAVKKTFIKPIDLLKENNSEDKFLVGLVSMGVSGILGGLFMCAIIKSMFGSFGSLVQIPYLKIFFVGLLSFAALFAATALAGYLIFDKLFKSKTSIKKMFVLVGLSSIIISVALAASTLLAFISLTEATLNIIIILIALSSLLWMVYMIKGYENYATKLDDNKFGYAFAIVYGVTYVLLYFYINNIIPALLK